MIKEQIIKAIIIKALKYGLKQLKAFMSREDFKKTVDEVLDRVENHFKDGSMPDDIIELVTGELRDYFQIEDND